ncbi:MAG: glycoside hydrolase family 31 protein [Dysgonomonas sp.]|nr:glycoside hydrolase family 31 protein [Dysgonomonas sp.]
MRKIVILLFLTLASILNVVGQEFKNPIVFGNNRLTLISPTLFRLEYAEDGKFLDRKTLFAYTRDSLLQDFEVRKTDDRKYEITTSALRMVFDHDGFPFGLHNFHVFYNMNGKEQKFTIRNIHKNNLGGAVSGYALDRVSKPIPLDDGLLSTDGWYIIDDAGKDILVDDWLHERDRSHVQDLYCFVYGKDYKAALGDLGRISGHVPMTRKYVHGVWYCRYWPYTSDEYLQLVNEYRDNNFPLDIMVFDMDWHTYGATVGTGHAGTRSWTGYTWNRELIPDPKNLIQTLLKDSIHVSLNEHPHDGIRPHESMYGDFMAAMGEKADGKSILFDAGNRKYMTNFLKYAHGESWDMGVAFWWLDWQQNYLYHNVRGTHTSNQKWLNKLYYDDSARNGLRGAGYSRWAGWGDHRHPIQFSGDAHANWEMLAFEIELTATSGNAGCYYWAHDIGGFYGGKDPEIYARWTQFGALSAALRVHSQKKADLDRRPWIWGEQATESTRRSYHFRSQILPYIYSNVWKTHKTMIPLSRAMYIDYNAYEKSYQNPQQFMFGDLLLAAPITSAGKGENLVAEQKVWFPEGEVWYDFFDAKAYKGGTEAKVSKDINEFPLFVKGGYLFPMQPYRSRPASSPLSELILRVYPGEDGANNTFTLYEDDGQTTEYEKGIYATTELIYQRNGNNVILTVSPSKGEYKGQPLKRSYKFELAAFGNVKNIKVNNKKVKASFDEASKMYILDIKPESIRKPIVVDIQVEE